MRRRCASHTAVSRPLPLRASFADTPENCEVDGCNQHIGGGGGQPHSHGDSFGAKCLYSSANYTSTTQHPPKIGWSLDGVDIYGRHIAETNLGYNVALDDCGGHTHDSFCYHYHTQLLSLTTTGKGAKDIAAGTTYPATTVGPHKCWRGDISKDVNFWATNPVGESVSKPCCGATQYFVKPGYTINGVGTQSFSTSGFTAQTCPSTSASSTSASATSSSMSTVSAIPATPSASKSGAASGTSSGAPTVSAAAPTTTAVGTTSALAVTMTATGTAATVSAASTANPTTSSLTTATGTGTAASTASAVSSAIATSSAVASSGVIPSTTAVGTTSAVSTAATASAASTASSVSPGVPTASAVFSAAAMATVSAVATAATNTATSTAAATGGTAVDCSKKANSANAACVAVSRLASVPYDIPMPACIPAFQDKSSAEFTLVATSLVRSIGKAVGTTFTGKLTDQVTFKCTARRQLEGAARRLSGVTGSATVEVPLPASLAASTLPGAVGDATQSTLAVTAIRMNALFASISETADVFAALRSATVLSIPSAPITVQVSPAFVASTPGLGAALAAAVVPAASATSTSGTTSNTALAALVVIPAALFGLVAWYCCRRPAKVTTKVQGSEAVEASNIAHVNPMPQTVRPPLILGDRALEGGTRV